MLEMHRCKLKRGRVEKEAECDHQSADKASSFETSL